MKTLRLSKVGRVGGAARSILLAGQPQQGTLMRWPSIGGRIRRLIEGEAAPIEAGTLSPAQQEVLCSEFLRWPEAAAIGLSRMEHLLLPIGRTLADLDVIGLTAEGTFVVAQVTHLPLEAAGKKLARLGTYQEGVTDCRVLFCNAPAVSQSDGVWIVPLRVAFEAMLARTTGRMWAEQACRSLEQAVLWDRDPT